MKNNKSKENLGIVQVKFEVNFPFQNVIKSQFSLNVILLNDILKDLCLNQKQLQVQIQQYTLRYQLDI